MRELDIRRESMNDVIVRNHLNIHKRKAERFKQLIDEGIGCKEIARREGVSDVTVRNHLHIFEYPDDIQNAVWDGKITLDYLHKLNPTTNRNLENAVSIARERLHSEQTKKKLPEGVKERAELFKKLIDEGIECKEIARMVGISRTSVDNYLHIFRYPDDIQNAVWDGKITLDYLHKLNPTTNRNLENAVSIARERLHSEQTKKKLPEGVTEQTKKKLPEGVKERAELFKKLRDGKINSSVRVARMVGMSRASVDNYLRIFKYPDDIQNAVWDGKITLNYLPKLNLTTNHNLENTISIARKRSQTDQIDKKLPEGVKERAELFKKLRDGGINSSLRIARMVGMSGTSVDNYLLIFKYPQDVQEAFFAGELSLNYACKLNTMAGIDLKKATSLARQAIENKRLEQKVVASCEERKVVTKERRNITDMVYKVDAQVGDLYYNLGGIDVMMSELDVVPPECLTILAVTLKNLQIKVKEILSQITL